MGFNVKYSPEKEDLDRCAELGRQVARAALELHASEPQAPARLRSFPSGKVLFRPSA